MFQGLTGLHLVIILGIVLLLFGATKLPALAKGLGQSINIFKKEMDTDDRKKPTTPDATDAASYGATAQQAAPVQQPVVNPGPTVQTNTVQPNTMQPNNDSRTQ
ncbi:twin-arginine translocase TatA/TatE family subunit [Curtobacterium sp. PsM8]|uniref:twin-arginine translocase TatA/TatE family subunit n=1 Tax=Curtobacterium sp. PsM8 TaxID=3030532 RepID=UPI00263A8354|nr:twin-arginine translocase TatA/TatE family subunit [Curtobacterium sp. PsM8]MDN4649578.1 twin-arginine translocase TatA/TatE family subunit [Curtobacterium sp. PsM8]